MLVANFGGWNIITFIFTIICYGFLETGNNTNMCLKKIVPFVETKMNSKNKAIFDKCDEEACRNVQEIVLRAFNTSQHQHFMDTRFTSSTVMIEQGFTNNLIKYICNDSILRALEQKSAIHWNPYIKTMLPVFVEDDGNSLIHSVSVYIFGLQDKAHILRQAIFHIMSMETNQGK